MKILKLKFLFLILASIALIYSCKKDNLTSQIEEAPNEIIKSSHPVIFNVGDQEVTLRDGGSGTTDAYSKTQLGNVKQNPYALANMKQAFENIKGSTISNVTPTHLQVKFTPSNFEELDTLLQTDAFFFDFPIDHEVTQMGDYYQELEADEYPVLYSTVKSDFNFPNVNYEVLQELFVSPYESMLTAEAFRLTGNIYISPFDDIDDETELNGFSGDCQPGCPSFPCCLGGEVDCNDDWLPNPNDCPFYDANCFENSNTLAEYLACVEAVIIAANNNSLYEINDCGCEVYKDIRKPGGCINVEDTQLGMQPVRRVKVIMWDAWFTGHYNTWTDDNGCWKINSRFHGNSWMWVKFTNSRGSIRGTQGKNFNSAWLWKRVVKDYVGNIWGPYYNNIEVNYMDVLDNSSTNHRYWAAATVNNSLHEFYDNAYLDGIAPPLLDLDIYIARNQTSGFALMAHYIGAAGVGILIGDGLLNSTFFEDPTTQIMASIGAGASAALFEKALPDIMIGTNFTTSDRLKALAFHEIAHASQYIKVGSGFWVTLGSQEIAADGWGTGAEIDAGVVQIAESWAEHIGDTYVDRTYLLNHSNTTNPALINSRRWINLLERDRLDNGHVPVAIFHDLIDDNSNAITGSSENSLVTNDGNTSGGGVTGYSNNTLFNEFDPSTINPVVYREKLKSILPSGITTANIDSLFSDYGF